MSVSSGQFTTASDGVVDVVKLSYFFGVSKQRLISIKTARPGGSRVRNVQKMSVSSEKQ